MTNVNRSSIVLNLTNVSGKFLKAHLELKIYNRQLSSLNQRLETPLNGKPVTLNNIPAAPVGLAELFLNPDGYRYKSIFVNVPSGRPLAVDETFFLDPSSAVPAFPTFTEISTAKPWEGLWEVLDQSGVSTASAWKKLSDLQKAGLFNIHAKAQGETVAGGQSVWSFVTEVMDFRPERILARVAPGLLGQLQGLPEKFRAVSGALHTFPQGWQPVGQNGSFKTFDQAGNLQVTFAQKGPDFLADIDIDDHSGAKHVEDVLKHTITGKDTHPYDIHQILAFFQGLDPGYELAPG